ncbi:MAG: hypothetical protein KGH94_03725 [Candidatus Micrarchaeota archaeon]|nr:hypothetical protein [Candidatus Micrarchaeota archaeon]
MQGAGIRKEIAAIKDRNKRVEADKAWETSWTRRGIIALFTYLAIALYLNAIHIAHPWLSAFIPAVGFLLSTLTMPFIKRVWIERVYERR